MPDCSKSSIITSKPATARIFAISGPKAWRTPTERQISPRSSRSCAGFLSIGMLIEREGSEETGVRAQPEHELTDQLEMRRPPVQMLRDGVDVAEAPLERLRHERHGRAGRLVAFIDHRLGLEDRVRGRQPDGHALREIDLAGERA